MKIDYELKARLLNEGLPAIVKDIEKSLYADFALNEYGQLISHKYDRATAENLRSLFDYDIYYECKKINLATFQRTKRLNHRVEEILLKGNAHFLTLTFKPETLENTTAETRRQYVYRFLKSQGGLYVANIDFGAKNGREHYHALISSNFVNFSLWHEHGAIKDEKVRTNNLDLHYPEHIKRLSKYVAKLSNHAIKKTTKRSVLIYSRV